eukprot:jgi/Psemu1/183239/e_gw1.30.132.1
MFNLDFLTASSTSLFPSLPSAAGALLPPLPSAGVGDRSENTLTNGGTSTAAGTAAGAFAPALSSDIHDTARLTDWKSVALLCEKKPEAAAYIGNDGWTALHHACNRRCPYPDVVKSLIRAYPDALLCSEEKGWLPLHYACRFKAPRDVVELLLHSDPEKGRVAVSRPDRKGRSPLYYAVRYDAPAGNGELISKLVELCPEAASTPDTDGRLPLHLACLTKRNWEDGLSHLFDAYPSAIAHRDKRELLPLHLVALRYCHGDGDLCDTGPRVTDVRERRLSRASEAAETERLVTAKDKREARELTNIYEILRADPTVL